MTPPHTEQLAFQAEIAQLLDIVAHSLYADKEIFVRELISNASDALEKLRYLALTESALTESALTESALADDGLPFEIDVSTDPTAKTLTIRDTGVGFTRDELIANLGTIAHSGSRAFLAAMANDPAKPSGVIGQFGVGFYSAFMVAKTVTVYTHSWRTDVPGYVWSSDGTGSYTIEEADGQTRGARIVIALRDDCADFASDWKIRDILQRHSAFISFPINLNGDRINTVQALWLRNKDEPTDDEYAEFYKFQAHAYDAPRMRLHFSTDAPLSVRALLFVPNRNPEQLGFGRGEAAVALYSQRVLIDPRPADLLPAWLRFLRGVVESENLPLNISRETPQDRSLIAKLKSLLTVRVLRFLDDESRHRPEAYTAFYREFARYIKEGAATEFSQRESLAKLLRYESSVTATGTLTSLEEYVSRMTPDQSEIYYLIGPSRSVLESGPYLEGFRARGLEVLYCFEAVDEYVMNNVITFADKRLVAADHASVQLPKVETEPDAADQPESTAGEASLDGLIAWMRETFDDRVTSIAVSHRLVDSPILAIATDKSTSPHMRQILRTMNRSEGQAPVRVNLEINPRHRIVRRLASIYASDADTARLIAQQLLDNALLSAGLLEDPAEMVTRLNQLLERM